jgi:predicted acylesterase/phospholipase RssA
MSFWKKTNPRNNSIDLVLSSSGVRAPCFIGALEAIQQKGYHIHRIAGSSGGAIVAAGYALGYSIDTLLDLAYRTPYQSFKSFKVRNLLSLRNPSVYTGQELDKYYQFLYKGATLRDFKTDCYISVVSIVGRDRQLLSASSHPDLPVWKAVRMSSTIPFIFPWYSLDEVPVTDGGLVARILDVFPDNPRPVVALRPRADYALRIPSSDVGRGSLFVWNYLKILAEYFLDAIDNQHVPQDEWAKTIVIPTFEIGGFNFNLTAREVKRLVQYGYNAVFISELLPPIS